MVQQVESGAGLIGVGEEGRVLHDEAESSATSSSSGVQRGIEVDGASAGLDGTVEAAVPSNSQGDEGAQGPSTVSASLGHGRMPLDPIDAFMPTNFVPVDGPVSDPPDVNPTPERSPTIGARNRWRRLRHTVAFANHMASIRAASSDLLENRGGGTAAFEGADTVAARWRPRGRQGMESMIVRQEKSFLSFFQDFYVACLKMPINHFLIAVFLAPVALGLFFTPFYLLDIAGLNFDEANKNDSSESQVQSAKQTVSIVVNVFLYALSLSTTFGGSPVTAFSPFCLLVGNVNTLLAQFLFVFLSGAVFARMSQPSHPVRCSKKAVIREGDFVPSVDDTKERFRVLAVRLVLTGPPPCELVDAKICLIFRIFIKLPTGSMFCTTQNLNLLRSEVSYLRYGIMVRHVIDRDSPVYGYTMKTLEEGDASFSLTIMALERTSMQPIFHLEDYFVHDGDVVWDGDYEDFISLNPKGQRVLDHSKIDALRPFKVAGIVSQAITRMEGNVAKRKEQDAGNSKVPSAISEPTVPAPAHQEPSQGDFAIEQKVLNRWVSGLRNRKLWEIKSSSFTRAPSDHAVRFQSTPRPKPPEIIAEADSGTGSNPTHPPP